MEVAHRPGLACKNQDTCKCNWLCKIRCEAIVSNLVRFVNRIYKQLAVRVERGAW